MKKQYIYPQNMRTKFKLWFWTLRDLIIIGAGLAISVILIAKLKVILPLALTMVYGFLSMRIDDFSVLDYIRKAWNFFISSQQYYEWREKKNG